MTQKGSENRGIIQQMAQFSSHLWKTDHEIFITDVSLEDKSVSVKFWNLSGSGARSSKLRKIFPKFVVRFL